MRPDSLTLEVGMAAPLVRGAAIAERIENRSEHLGAEDAWLDRLG